MNFIIGSGGGIRTHNPSVNSRVLLPLSYPRMKIMVETRGFEPPTPCLQGRCSPN